MNRILIALFTVFALSGCEQLRVESIPTGKAIACDPELVGWWTGSTEDSADEVFVHVNSDCTKWSSIERDNEERFKIDDLGEDFKFQMVEVNADRILVVSPAKLDDSEKYILDGYALFRYTTESGKLKLYAGDTRKEAHRIADGKIAGRVEARHVGDCSGGAICEVNSLVTGTSDDIRSWLIRFKPLDQKYATFVRVPISDTPELDALLKSPPADGKPKPHE